MRARLTAGLLCYAQDSVRLIRHGDDGEHPKAAGCGMRVFLVGTVVVLILGVAFARPGLPCRRYTPPRTRVDQGCVNQGNDRRIGAKFICGSQRRFSWKSENRPNLLTIGSSEGVHFAVAWPPYLVVNAPASNGNWRMFRVGFRYDRNWRGYIFPTAACKCIDSPLLY